MTFTPLHKSAISNALRNGLSFALFRDKGSDEIAFICDDHSEKPTLSNKRFFAVKWLNKYADRIEIADKLSIEQAAEYTSERKYSLAEPWAISTSHSDYIASVRMLIDDLKANGGKTVISRVISLPHSQDIASITEQYFSVNPAAYCCLLHTPQTGCWLIASPELLLSADFNTKTFDTLALAGTRSIKNSSNKTQKWDSKNIIEQRIVKDYIIQTLNDLHVDFQVSNEETLQTGNIEHIATFISGNIDNHADVEHIIDALNPTPALCGSPRERAIDNIRSTEQHQRRLYGGYFGCADENNFKAIVTLRCAQLSLTNSCLYAGGGITADSNAQTEWDETSLKSCVLSNIIMNKQNE
jgi:isochorismate synthase